MPNATRYYDKLVNEYAQWLAMPARSRAKLMVEDSRGDDATRSYYLLHAALTSPNTKRVLFDARQAEVFSETAEQLPHHVQRRLHLPFDSFYMEFTEPVLVGAMQPGHTDTARAMLIVDLSDSLTGKARSKFGAKGEEEDIELPLIQTTMFLSSQDENGLTQYVDRTWKWSLEQGIAFPSAASVRNSDDPSTLLDGNPLPPELVDDSLIPALLPVVGAENRYFGWWERVTQDYTDLISWCVTYIMAKGIRIVPEPESRQVRRFREQRNLPPMWHVVEVEPKFYPHAAPSAEEPKWHHSYRYDVIGHLRFGRHKTREGYSETIEWVPPHQRGLANDLYIPATHSVKHGKIVSQRMTEYFRED